MTLAPLILRNPVQRQRRDTSRPEGACIVGHQTTSYAGLTAMGLLNRSTAQRQRDADGHEHPAASLIKPPPYPLKPRADAVSHAGNEQLGDDFGYREGAGHDGELHQEAAGRVDELREKGGEEQEPFGIVSTDSAPCRNSDQPDLASAAP